MTKLEIHLPDPLGDFVRARAEVEQHADPSRYVQDLIEREQARLKGLEELKERLAKAEATPMSRRQVPEIMDAIDEKLRRDGVL